MISIKILQNMLYNQNYCLLKESINHKDIRGFIFSLLSNTHFYLSYIFVTQLQIKRNVKGHNKNHKEINKLIKSLKGE